MENFPPVPCVSHLNGIACTIVIVIIIIIIRLHPVPSTPPSLDGLIYIFIFDYLSSYCYCVILRCICNCINSFSISNESTEVQTLGTIHIHKIHGLTKNAKNKNESSKI